MKPKYDMNRGRIQAQGKSCEKSQKWSQLEIPTKQDGRDNAELLAKQLTKKEYDERRRGFDKLYRFINQAPSTGCEECKRSYTPYPPIEDVRVDVEIIKGKAFKDD